MGSGASVRPSPNAVTDPNTFFVSNASRFTLKVVAKMEKDVPPPKKDGNGTAKEVADSPKHSAVDEPKKKPSAADDSKTIGMQEVKEFRGKFVQIFLLDKHEKETPLGAQRPTQPCRSVIVTETKALKTSACPLSGTDDPNAWIAAGGANLYPGEFYVANASGGKLVVVAHDKRRNDIDGRVLKHKEAVAFRGDTARIFTSTGKEIHTGDVQVRTSLIVASDDRVLRSRQLVGDDVNTEKWITADGKFCKP